MDRALSHLPTWETVDNKKLLEVRREERLPGANAMHDDRRVHIYGSGANPSPSNPFTGRGRGQYALDPGQVPGADADPALLEMVFLHEIGHDAHDNFDLAVFEK